MSIMNFNTPKKSLLSNFKAVKLILGIGSLAAVIGLGSTLAASINLNAGAAVEFGQGVAQTVSCDSDGITITPYSTFVNDGSDSAFYFSSFVISGVSANCSGKVFKIRAYSKNDSDALYWPSDPSDNSFEFGFKSNDYWYDVSSCMSMTYQTTDSADNNKVTIDWSSCVPLDATFATGVDRITVETSDVASSDIFPAAYQLGDTGPGDGIIFFVKSAGAFHKSFTETGDCELMGACQTYTVDLTSAEQAALPFDYLEAFATGYDLVSWSSAGRSINTGASAAFGAGQLNTNNIIAEFPGDTTANNAAVYANAYSNLARSDWFLPSYQELLLLMILNLEALANGYDFGLAGHNFWSSTSGDLTNSESSGPSQLHGFVNLLSPLSIMAIRSF